MDATDRPQIVEHCHKPLNYVVYDTRWVPSSARFVVLGCHPRGTGALQVMELKKGGVDIVHEVPFASNTRALLLTGYTVLQSEKHAAFKCGTFGASSLAERHLATGDFDGRLSIWSHTARSPTSVTLLYRAGTWSAPRCLCIRSKHTTSLSTPLTGNCHHSLLSIAPGTESSLVRRCGGLNIGGGAPELVTGSRDGASPICLSSWLSCGTQVL